MGRGGNASRVIDLEEVKKHHAKDDLWLSIEGKVYDVTSFAPKHPGRLGPLMHLAGKDATVLFNNFHHDVVKKYLPPMCVGKLEENKKKRKSGTATHKDLYATLRKEMVDAGMFKNDVSYYYPIAARLALMLATVVSLVVLGKGRTWMQFLAAPVLGMFFQQYLLVGHDWCHNTIRSRKQDYNNTVYFGAVTTGISGMWWRYSHNNHHIITNSLENDADIQHLPFFAVHQGYFKNIWSNWQRRVLPFDTFANIMVRNQYYLFYPVMAVARFYLHFQSLLFITTEPNLPMWGRIAELIGLSLHVSWVGTLAAQLPTWGAMLGWIFTVYAFAGILHVQICISHFGMEVYENMELDNGSEDFLTTQLATTMDVDCPEWMDWFHGGLQFQVEHHLFPLIPRQNLRKSRDILVRFCKKHKLNYVSVPFIEANRVVLGRLAEVADKCPELPFKKSALYGLLNAQG